MLLSLHFHPSIYTERTSYWLTFSHRSVIASVRSEHRFYIGNKAQTEWAKILQKYMIVLPENDFTHTISWWLFFSSFMSSQKPQNFCIIFKHHHVIRYYVSGCSVPPTLKRYFFQELFPVTTSTLCMKLYNKLISSFDFLKNVNQLVWICFLYLLKIR